MLKYLTPKSEEKAKEKVGMETFMAYRQLCGVTDHLLADTPQTEIQEAADLLEVAYRNRVMTNLTQLTHCFHDIWDALDNIRVALETIAKNSEK